MKLVVLLVFGLTMFSRAMALPLAELFPNSTVIPGWTTAGAVQVFDTSTIEQRINGGAVKYKQNGFREAGFQTYVNNSNEISVQVYDQATPAGARAMYAYFTNPGNEILVASLGDSCAVETTAMFTYMMLVCRGSYFGIFGMPKDESVLTEAKKIAAYIDNRILASPVRKSTMNTSWGTIKSAFFR